MKNHVHVGACYRDSSVYWNRWRVARVYADILGTPHAVMVNLSDPTVSRTLACLTLNDRRRYCRINGGGNDRPVMARQPCAAAHAAMAESAAA